MMRRLGITSNSSSAASLSEVGWGSWLLARRWTALKVLLAVILLAWPVFSGNMYYVSVMTNAGLYMILTVAVGLITGQAGQLSFGHAAFYAMGAYVSGLLVVKLGVPTLVAWIAGAVVAGIIALVIGRPVLKLRYFYLALATIGLVMIVVALVSTLTSLTGGLSGFYGVSPLNIAGFEIDTFLRKYYLVWIVALAILLFADRLLKYRVGRALRAIATSETASSTLGMRNSNWKLRTFVVSAVFCGIAGGLYVFVNSMATPAVFNFNASILPMVMMLLGGSSLWTGVLGAILMTWVVQGLGGVQQYSGLVYAVILILLLLFLPAGITGGLRPEHRKRLLSLFRWGRSVDDSECLVPAGDSSFAQVRAVAPVNATANAWTGPQTTNGEAGGKATVIGGELLRVESLTVKFGGLIAVDDVSISVNEGEIVALIGPNGAGKTTLFNAMSRLQRSDGGRLWFRGAETTKLNAADVARLGQARTFQNLRLFTNMSVLENVLVGCHRHEKSGFWAGGTGLFGQRREEKASRERALAALCVVGLEDEADRPAISLPAGRQRLVEIARALASEPDLLMLDEPACGMNSAERIDLVDKIRKIRESGVTVLLVEHDVGMVMGLCDRVYVLDFGRLIASGVPEEVRKNPAVLEAYLGVEKSEKTSVCSGQPREEPPVSESGDSLVVEDLTTCYGSIRAIQHVSLAVGATEVVAVVGSNGAGKTTLLHTISGLLTPTTGSVTYRETDLLRISPNKIPALGLCQVPAGRQLFPALSVEDNLVVGSSCRSDWRKALKAQIAYVYELFPILGERRLQLAGRLSGGEQQMLAIGRALIGSPTMLLLDETSMGLAPLVTERIFEAVVKLNKGGMAILMVEQNVELALSIADRVVVLRTGAVAFTGDAGAFRDNDQMRRAYLGEDPAERRGLQS